MVIQERPSPWFCISVRNRAVLYLNMRESDKAVQDFDKLISLEAGDAYAHQLKEIALANLGKHDVAVRDFDRAIELDPGDAESYTIKCSRRVPSVRPLGGYGRSFACRFLQFGGPFGACTRLGLMWYTCSVSL